MGRPQFSATTSVPLAMNDEVNASPTVRPASQVRRAGPKSIPAPVKPARFEFDQESSAPFFIQTVAYSPPPESGSRAGGLMDLDATPWTKAPPRLVSTDSVSPFESDPPEVPESGPYFVESDPAESAEPEVEFEQLDISWRDDACDLIPMLRDDFCSLFNWRNAIILGAGVGGALAIREHLDGDVRDYTLRHRMLWGEGSQVMRQFGEFSYQVPFIAAVYGWGLWTQNEHTHEFSKALISAYTITSITTVTIKGVTNTRRPTDQFQDGRYGFPSFHTASTFSMAAVIDEYYGWPAGVPAYVLAGLVGWSRIDQREHDLSDVFFGSLLGLVIGKTVAWAHQDRMENHRIVPYYDPATRTLGAMLHCRF